MIFFLSQEVLGVIYPGLNPFKVINSVDADFICRQRFNLFYVPKHAKVGYSSVLRGHDIMADFLLNRVPCSRVSIYEKGHNVPLSCVKNKVKI